MFVPPHNALSKRGLAAVGAAGPEHPRIVSVVPAVDAAVGPTHARQLVARPAVSRVDRPLAKRIASSIPHVLRYADHAEFGCHSLIPGTTLEELVAGFDEARAAGGDFCLATHYWEVERRDENA